MKRVFVIQPNAQLTGSPRSLLEICKLYKNGNTFDFHVYFLRNGAIIDLFRENGISIVNKNYYGFNTRILSFFQLFFLIFFKYRDAILILNSSASLRGLILVILVGKRGVVYIREFEEMMGKLSYLRIFFLGKVKNIITLTIANLKWVKQINSNIENFDTIGNFIDEEWRVNDLDILINDKSLRLSNINSKPKICIVGKMDLRKGIDFFIKFMTEQCEKYNFMIIGDFHESLYLSNENRKLLDQFCQAGSLSITGIVPDTREYYCRNDIYICLSRSEVFSRSIIEAQTLGLPTLAWNLDTHENLIPNGNLVEFGDLAELELKIQLILSNYIYFAKEAILTSKKFDKLNFKNDFENYITSLELK